MPGVAMAMTEFASRYRLDGQHLLEDPLAQILAVVSEPLASQAREIGEQLRARLAACAGELTLGHCHGDNHGGNALIADGPDGQLIVGWFDFDDGGPGFLAYDPRDLPLVCSTPSPDPPTSENPAGRFGPRSSAAIARFARSRLVFAARTALLVSIRHINFCGQYASRLPEWGAGFISEDWFRRELDLIRKWDGVATPAAD